MKGKKAIVKIILYILAFIVIVSGIICGIWAYKLVTRKSYEYGELGIQNVFKIGYFDYDGGLALYKDGTNLNLYTSETDFKPLEDGFKFNGLTKTYEVIFNDIEIVNAEVYAGYVKFNQEFEFLDVNNNLLNTSLMTVRVEFLANKTKMKVAVETENIAYMRQYIDNNAFKLSIREIKE